MKYSRTSVPGLFVIGAVTAIILSGIGRADSLGIALVRAIVGVALLVLFASTANGLSQTGAPLKDISPGTYRVLSATEEVFSDGYIVFVVAKAIRDASGNYSGTNAGYFLYGLPRLAFEGDVNLKADVLRVHQNGSFKKLQFVHSDTAKRSA